MLFIKLQNTNLKQLTLSVILYTHTLIIFDGSYMQFPFKSTNINRKLYLIRIFLYLCILI